MLVDKLLKPLFHLVGLAGFRRKPGLSAAQLQHIHINHAMAKGLQRLYFKKGV